MVENQTLDCCNVACYEFCSGYNSPTMKRAETHCWEKECTESKKRGTICSRMGQIASWEVSFRTAESIWL